MKKPTKTKQLPGGASQIEVPSITSQPAKDHDVMVVAQIASQLLQRSDYTRAVKRALTLLDECVVALKHRADEAAEASVAAPLRPKTVLSAMTWREFLSEATGESRLDRAETKFYDAIKLRIQDGRAARALGRENVLPRQPTLDDWRTHLSTVSKTTTKEALAYTARLRESDLVPPDEVRTHRGLFARYYPLHTSLSRAESSLTHSKTGGKKGHPKKR